MKSQISRAALNMLNMTEYLVMSMRIYQHNVIQRLEDIFGPPAGGGDGGAGGPDWNLVQESYIGILETSATEVRRLDQVHRFNKVKLAEGRRHRKGLVGQLKTRHRDLRKSISGTYGDPALALVGLDAPPENRYLAIREQQLEILQRMRNPELSSRLPAPRGGQAGLDLTGLATAIEAEILDLEAAMEAIKRMRTQVDESKVIRDETLKQHYRRYLNIARIMEGNLRLAGLDELVERFRAPGPPKRKSSTSPAGGNTGGDPSGDQEDASETSEKAPPATG